MIGLAVSDYLDTMTAISCQRSVSSIISAINVN